MASVCMYLKRATMAGGGEGDEKFFVDGEKFPSWFGTGSEDYFGFAYANPTPFSKPFHAQVHQDGGINGSGSKVNTRLQVSDSIPFQNGFQGCIEKYLDNEKLNMPRPPIGILPPVEMTHIRR